jgi:hypothetical protein
MSMVLQFDPERVAERKKGRLKRRVYFSPGPWATIHIDQNDKLLKWGFGLHGGTDGNGVWCSVSEFTVLLCVLDDQVLYDSLRG